MSARPSLASAKVGIASTPWDPTSANARRGTSRARPATGVKVREDPHLDFWDTPIPNGPGASKSGFFSEVEMGHSSHSRLDPALPKRGF